jgi:hypothetical protein
MALVLSGTAQNVVAQVQLGPSSATAWIEAHYEELRSQWVAVRLKESALVASASTLSQLLAATDPAALKACLVQYVYTLEQEQHIPGLWWQQ